MYPPIFPTIKASAAVRALIGSGASGADPVRFYQFGMAPQKVVKPYAVWQRVGGSPENYLDRVPDMDSLPLQVDVYASEQQGAEVARNVVVALRDAIEPVAHITAWLGESQDPETQNYRSSFQVDWWVPRT
jgi:hypothetical protein